MVKIALVGPEIDRGSKLLATLDAAKTKVNVALWAVLPEYEDWRMIVASRQFDKMDLRRAYGLLSEAADAAGFSPFNTPTTLILPMSDSTIKDLRRRFSKAGDVEGMRPGGQMIGNRFVEDAYVYRIS